MRAADYIATGFTGVATGHAGAEDSAARRAGNAVIFESSVGAKTM